MICEAAARWIQCAALRFSGREPLKFVHFHLHIETVERDTTQRNRRDTDG